MMRLELAKQRREELLREAELRHRAKALRATRKRDAGRRTESWDGRSEDIPDVSSSV